MVSFKKNSFNLLITSIIVMIIGIFFSSNLSFYKTTNLKNNLLINKKRIDKIDNAMKNYFLKNKKFPCPALLNCDKNNCVNSDYKLGQMFSRDNECVTDNNGVFSSGDLLYGTIPTLDLGIPSEYMSDFYGNKIVYIINKNLTKKVENIDFTSNLYSLLFSKNNTYGRYKYNSKSVGYFEKTNKINMPIENFEFDSTYRNFIYHNISNKNFNLYNYKNVIKECSEYIYQSDIDIYDLNLTEVEVDEEEKSDSYAFSNGVQTWTVPEGVIKVKLEVWGAQGGGYDNNGGKGGYSYGYLNVNFGDILYIYVGGQGKSSSSVGSVSGGYNGGGNGYISYSINDSGRGSAIGGGGGATDIRKGGTSLSDRIIIAGGGGGGTYSMYCKSSINGGIGAGGNNNAGNGSQCDGSSSYGRGATINNYGSAGCHGGSCGVDGALGQGGSINVSGGSAASGGGGGYYGGGSSSHAGGNWASSSAGGGSGYIGGVYDGGGSNGVREGNGKAVITYTIKKNILNYEKTNERKAVFTFKKAKYGEIVFSNELCPTLNSLYANQSDYFYKSTYKNNENGILYNNRMAKRCGENGIWDTDFIYTCEKSNYCSNPNNDSNWNNFSFDIVNNGIIKNNEGNIKLKCINSQYYNID